MAEKPESIYFHFVLDDNHFYFADIFLRLKIVHALKCLHRQAMRPLVHLKQSLKVSVQSPTLNSVNSDKVFQTSP